MHILFVVSHLKMSSTVALSGKGKMLSTLSLANHASLLALSAKRAKCFFHVNVATCENKSDNATDLFS